jgi:hypothetical protein
LSAAFALTVTVALTEEPLEGEVTETVGAVVSAVVDAAWLTVEVLPAMVMVPLREEVAGFA